MIDRAEGVWVWTERGKKLMDAFAGLAVDCGCNTSGGRCGPRSDPVR
jgi:adenosylmethionine-8-amino-7-oxononanoate aminotransferase